MTIATHLSKLRNHADLVSTGVSSKQASRIIFDIDSADINIDYAKISLSLTQCVGNYLNQLNQSELDEFVMRLEATNMAGQVHAIFCDEDGVWEFETGTFETVSLGNIPFDDRLIFMEILEKML